MERGLGIRSGQNKQGWEQSDFPVLCESCLGDNPYLRMLKDPYGKECKICTRPFTVFRWKAGTKGRYKKTEVCQTCGKMKNVCQTCLFDLEYGLPVQVRDKFLEENQVVIPANTANRDFFIEQANRNIGNLELPYFKTRNPILEKMAKKGPDYRKNEPHICSFFVKGECKRGLECPYKHEIREENELSEQNLKDRFHGKNDPLANKILKNYFGDKEKINHPVDLTNTTLVIPALTEDITIDDIQKSLEGRGEIMAIKIVNKKIAFITFKERKDAENTISELYRSLIIKEKNLPLRWKRADAKSNTEEPFYDNEDKLLVPDNYAKNQPRPPLLPPPEIKSDPNLEKSHMLKIIKKSQHENNLYPSMNPNALGGKSQFISNQYNQRT